MQGNTINIDNKEGLMSEETNITEIVVNKSKKAIIIKIVIVLVVILVIAVSFFGWEWYKQVEEVAKNPQNKVIVKVGEEKLYQKDLNTELAAYPTKDEAAKKLLLAKMVEESKLIQEAKKEKSFSIDKSIYDSSTKDYLKRMEVIQQIKIENSNKNAGLKGSIISVWFLNNRVGPLGYDKAKALALEKITYLHNQVKNSKITMEQAAENIKNDTSLAQLDPTSYKTNAILLFNVSSGEEITWESEFDKILWGLKDGEVSAIYLAKSADFDNKNQIVPAYYMFGQAEKKATKANKETKYEVIYY